MDAASPAQNCQTMESSSPEQNTLGEKHELGSEQVQSEPMDARIVGSDAQNCQMMESLSPKQSTLQEKHELGSEHLQSETMETRIVESSAQENCQTIESSSPIQNTLQEKQSCQTIESSSLKQNTSQEKDELGLEHVQIEPMDTMIIEADVQNTSQEKQNCQTIESSSPKQNTSQEKHEPILEHVQIEPMGTRIVEADAQDKCQTTESSSPKQNTLGQKHEFGPEHVQSEPMENRIVESNAQGNCQTIESSSPIQNTLQEKQNCQTRESSRPKQNTSQENCQTIEGSRPKQNTSQEKHNLGLEHVQIEPMDPRIIEADAQDKCQTTENLRPKQNTLGEKHAFGPEDLQSETLETRIVGSDSVDIERLGAPPKDAAKSSKRSSSKENQISSRLLKRKYLLRSSTSSPTVLHSNLHGTCKPSDPSISSVNVSTEKQKKRKKRKSTKKTFNDEFLQIRKRLRYSLNRMGYEHSLIDAYSGEGWKGQSIEKIKPEQELQRATSEILRCKLKIRDLFQHLDSLCAEGKLQQSLFDSEGQICSEDIFCAKCGSKDFSADNDIILCDGICDRGFHQMCLDPPLLKDDIPPGDEGWLCPGCDCKVDCIDLLNDFQGTDLSLSDNWEKVFPEAAATASGDKPDDNFGLPSDDSEDNDYDPDGPELDERVQTEGSSSEESDFTSASDDLGALAHDEQYSGLPSDDSEDVDYDPNAPDIDEQIKKESSSSDFTSDTENFSASSDGNGSSGRNVLMLSSVDGGKLFTGSSNRRSEMARKKKQSVNDELLSILEPDPSQGNASPVLVKRQRERLDYKKLYDETYGNGPSDSSDDEEWTDTDEPGKRKNDGIGKESVVSPRRNSQTSRTNTRGTQQNLKETESTPKRRTRQKLDTEGAYHLATETHKDSLGPDSTGKVVTASASRRSTRSTQRNLKETENTPKRTRQKLDLESEDSLVAETQKDSPGPDSTGKTATASPSRAFGKAVTQGLFESFKEDEYPTRDKKENLAKGLGITFRQVSTWFENARRSFRQSSNTAGRMKKVSQSTDTALTLTNGKLLESETETLDKDGVTNEAVHQELGKTGITAKECYSQDVDIGKLMKVESNPKESSSSNLRNQKKGKLDDRTSKEALSTKETPIKGTTPDSVRVRATRKNGRNTNQEVTRSQIQTRSRKAIT